MARVAALFCLLLVGSILLLAKSIEIEVLPRHPPEHIAGVTYEVLDVFQSYPVDRQNTDQTWKFFSTCYGLSGFREIIHSYSGLTFEGLSKPCYSILRNCRFDQSMTDSAKFCVSDNPRRRYDYMLYYTESDKNKLQIYGSNPTGKCPSRKLETYSRLGNIWYPCVCDCENSASQADRYFSLLDVVSDEGKVVTGVRFRKIHHVFYIQIQQAQLGWKRLVGGKADWKDIEEVSKFQLLSKNVSEYYREEGNDDESLKFHKNDLVYAVTTEQNTVLLDNLKCGTNEVLTGLRFQQFGQDLRLEIQVTPFLEDSGILERHASRWIYNDPEKSYRIESESKKTNVPERDDSSRYSSFGNQYVKFRVSDFETDLGQTTVPLIDIRDAVADDESQPLSGVGIAHHNSDNSAGFIAFRIFYHDH